MGGRDVAHFLQHGQGERVMQSIDDRMRAPGFKTFAERVANERPRRLKNAQHILGFGMTFLDRALGGIFRNDLVLLGAKTSGGKTELATTVALHNARNKKRVHYFALEAEEDEIERRIKFRALSRMVQAHSRENARRLNYLDWLGGKLDDITGPFEARVEQMLVEQLPTLYTYYKTGDFTADTLVKAFKSVEGETDLIVLDHLHYVDSADSNENRGFKIITKKLRDVALQIGRPVLCVAHVRKGERGSDQLVPTIEDFHGTSDVPKIATKAIMLAPAYGYVQVDYECVVCENVVERTADEGQPKACPKCNTERPRWLKRKRTHIWPTFVSVLKCRPDGSRARYTAVVNFDARANEYAREFQLGRLIERGERFEVLDPHEEPPWAR